MGMLGSTRLGREVGREVGDTSPLNVKHLDEVAWSHINRSIAISSLKL